MAAVVLVTAGFVVITYKQQEPIQTVSKSWQDNLREGNFRLDFIGQA